LLVSCLIKKVTINFLMKPAKDIITEGIKVQYRPFCLLTIIVFVLVNLQLISSVGASSVGWTQTYGGLGIDRAASLVETSDGGYAIAGYTDPSGTGIYDCWLVKTDEYGIIPEFPSWTILPLFLAVTVSGIVVRKRLFHNRS
jgi:hypothetical protein